MGSGWFAEHWLTGLRRLDRHGVGARFPSDVASLDQLMDAYSVPGVSIAVGLADGRQWSAAHGTVGTGLPDRVDAHTVFQACSISKHVAAYGTLRLVAQGRLDLDADIHTYLTSWGLPAGPDGRWRVTVRQLLAHTAGLSSNWFRGYAEGERLPTMPQTLRGEPPANTPPVRTSLVPGSRFRYSGSHYAVLQQLLVDATGTAFEELMRALVLDPVGMMDSSFDQRFPYERAGSVARGHHAGGTPVPGGWRTVPEMAGAGLWTTPTDLVRLALEIGRAADGASTLLPPGLAGQMLTAQVPGGYGLGTDLADPAGTGRYGHTGGNVGYGCFAFGWRGPGPDAPPRGVAVAAMTNSEDGREVLIAILSLAERWRAVGPSDEPTAHLAAPDELTGRYLLRPDYPVDVAAVDGRLELRLPGQPPTALLALGDGRYRIPDLDCEVAFRPAGDGIMELRQEGATQTATRSP